MKESMEKHEVGFTLSEEIRAKVLTEAKSGAPEFSIFVPLKTGGITVRCYQGNDALERARAGRNALSETKEMVSDIEALTTTIFVFFA